MAIRGAGASLTEKERRQDAIDAFLVNNFDGMLGKGAAWIVLFGGIGVVWLLVYGRYFDLLLAALALGVTTFAAIAGDIIDKAGRRRLLAGQTVRGRSLHVAHRAYTFMILAVSGYLVFRNLSLSFPALRDGDESLYFSWILCLVITSAPGIFLAWRRRERSFGLAGFVMLLVNAAAFLAASGTWDEWGGLAMVYTVGFCTAFGVSLLPLRPLPAPPTS